MEKIVLIGSGGHAKVVIDIIRSTNEYEIIGITENDSKKHGMEILGVPVLGDDSILPEIHKGGVKNAFVCLGALNNMALRDRIFWSLKDIGFIIPTLIHKRAVVSPYSIVEEGSCVMAGAIVNPGAAIGANCIVNSGAVVEHDCKISRNTHISPNASIAGGAVIGSNSHIGIGSTVIQGIVIGSNVIIGAGAVVIHNIEDNVTAVGVPAKIIKRR